MSTAAHSVCKTCLVPLDYSGRGRRPIYCKDHASAAKSKATVLARQRKRAHANGEAVSKWGDLWLIDGKPVKRKVSQSVYVQPADDGLRYTMILLDDPRENTVIVTASDASCLSRIKENGLPVGTSTTIKDLSAQLYASSQEADNHPWHKGEGKDWWQIEEWAHTPISFDVRDMVQMHGEQSDVTYSQYELDMYADKIDAMSEAEYESLVFSIRARRQKVNGL